MSTPDFFRSRLDQIAYSSDRGRLFQSEGGRRFSVMVLPPK